MTIAGLTDEEVTAIAAESEEIIAQRESLESLQKALENGRAKFGSIMKIGAGR